MRDMTAGEFSEGFQFNYETWTPGSVVTMMNVPWSSDYQDVYLPKSLEDQHEFFFRKATDGKSLSVTKVCYARVGEPVRLAIPFNEANRFNYMRVVNRQSHVGEPSRAYYYFIQDVRHISPSVTEFAIMLDVWQTYVFDIELGRAYVEQGHVGIAQEDSHKDYGRKYLMEPEGFELGAEMVTLSASAKRMATLSDNDDSDPTVDVLVWSNTDLGTDWGKLEDPKMDLATGSKSSGGLPQAMSCYHFKSTSDFSTFAAHVSKCPWIAQGITAIYGVPSGMVGDGSAKERDYSFTDFGNVEVKGTVRQLDSVSGKVSDIIVERDIRKPLTDYLGARYRNLKKFLTAPYSMVEVTTYTGAPLMLRPECIYEKKLMLRVLPDLSLPGPKIIMFPLGYNARSYTKPALSQGKLSFYDQVDGDFLDTQTGIYNLPTLSILNNNYLAYMSSNAHSIAFQHSSADWSQQKALTGNNLAFDQSSAGIALNSEMNRIGNGEAAGQATIGMAAGIAQTALGGGFMQNATGSNGQTMRDGNGKAMRSVNNAALGGAAVGAASTAASTGLGIYANNRRTNATNSNAAYMRDTNKAYADFAARGDYAQSIAAINAKSQDMRVVAPSTIGQVGGEQFALAYLNWSIFCKVKCVQESALNAIGEYWLRYGYKINRFYDFQGNLERLRVMDRFSYWRLREVYILTSEAPESYRMAIRGILEKGLTVWSNPNDIGRIDPATNNPIFGKYI